MRIMSSVKEWWKRNISTQYVICRNGIIGWLVYKDGNLEAKTARIFDRSELLHHIYWKKTPHFEAKLEGALQFNGLLAKIYLWHCSKKLGKSYALKLVEVTKMIFITDLTGITAN